MRETPAWFWPNLLSLDAPIVALVWQDLAARSFDNPLRLAARAVLGLTVWAIYLADRLLDIRAAGPAANTARHDFYRRHPGEFTALLAVVIAVDAFLAVAQLRSAVFMHGLAVAVCVGAYLCIFPRRSSGWEKQVLAAILFSAGVLLVSETSLGPWQLLVPAFAFAGLCLCNLVLIELWEQHRDRPRMWLAPAAIAVLAMVRSAGTWQYAVAVSAVFLAALAISGRRLTVGAKRVLADAALLTPLLFR